MQAHLITGCRWPSTAMPAWSSARVSHATGALMPAGADGRTTATEGITTGSLIAPARATAELTTRTAPTPRPTPTSRSKNKKKPCLCERASSYSWQCLRYSAL